MVKYFFTLVVLLAVLISCSSPEKSPAIPAVTGGSVSQPSQPVLSGWEAEWEKVVREARKEGRVVIYTGIGSELRQDLTRAFELRYKGINLEFYSGRGPEITQKLLSEHRAGLYWADLYISGATTPLTQLKPAGALVPLEPFLMFPEVLDPKVWFEGQVPFIDKDKMILAFMARPNPPLTINTSVIKENELKSYKDLLNPKWKGKIVLDDPTAAGPGQKWFGVVGTRIMDMNYMREFAKQSPVITRDARLAVEWVAQGKLPIGLSLQSPIVTEFQNAGAPLIQISPVEGDYITSGFGNIAAVKGLPHKNSAILFTNWLLSKEGQLAWAKSEMRQSARVDIPIDYLAKEHIRPTGIKYISGDDEDLLLEQPKQAELAKEIFKTSLGR